MSKGNQKHTRFIGQDILPPFDSSITKFITSKCHIFHYYFNRHCPGETQQKIWWSSFLLSLPWFLYLNYPFEANRFVITLYESGRHILAPHLRHKKSQGIRLRYTVVSCGFLIYFHSQTFTEQFPVSSTSYSNTPIILFRNDIFPPSDAEDV